MAAVKRAVRVGTRIREELAAMLARDVRDPRVAGAIVSDVKLTDDLGLAKIYVRAMTGDAPAARKSLLAGLEAASGMLRRELGARLGLRISPKLAFYIDESIEKRVRIDALLDEVAREPKAIEDEASGDGGDGDEQGTKG
jgi:ribosome-binding factor A